MSSDVSFSCFTEESNRVSSALIERLCAVYSAAIFEMAAYCLTMPISVTPSSFLPKSTLAFMPTL